HPHLPQGAPTSPAVANLVAFRLDRRLQGLAESFGASYTRYADDLAFSGPRSLGRTSSSLVRLVSTIARVEGFRVNTTKTRVRSAGQRQRLGGIVVNERPNLARDELDRLRAMLHEAVRRGPEVANREQRPDFRSHLLGRIAWAESVNAARAEKLHSMF